MNVQFTDKQIRDLVNHLESYMIMHDIEFTNTNDHIASIYCAIQFGNEFMDSVDKGEIKVYEE